MTYKFVVKNNFKLSVGANYKALKINGKRKPKLLLLETLLYRLNFKCIKPISSKL